MASLEEIRAKLLQQQQKAEGGNRTGGDNAVFPFWNTPEGGTTTLRFLPDNNPDNTFFWEERLVIKLPFQGVKGEHDREVLVQVPCMEMYKETCPILAETKPWWKDDSLQDLARRYWKKKSYIFQGFVVNSGFDEKDAPENPIRRFIINPSIFEIIKGSLMDPEMEDLPIDFLAGRDFSLKKTTKGGYANYATSRWSMKPRPLGVDEMSAIETHGLQNLRDFLPKKPTAEELEAIKEMFQASVNDEAFDPERWGQFYRPAGSFNNAPAGEATSTVTRPTPTVATPAVSAPAPTPAPVTPVASSTIVEDAPAAPATTGKNEVSEIMRRIQERRQQGGQ